MHIHICVHGQKQGLHSHLGTRTEAKASLTSVYMTEAKAYQALAGILGSGLHASYNIQTTVGPG